MYELESRRGELEDKAAIVARACTGARGAQRDRRGRSLHTPPTRSSRRGRDARLAATMMAHLTLVALLTRQIMGTRAKATTSASAKN